MYNMKTFINGILDASEVNQTTINIAEKVYSLFQTDYANFTPALYLDGFATKFDTYENVRVKGRMVTGGGLQAIFGRYGQKIEFTVYPNDGSIQLFIILHL